MFFYIILYFIVEFSKHSVQKDNERSIAAFKTSLMQKDDKSDNSEDTLLYERTGYINISLNVLLILLSLLRTDTSTRLSILARMKAVSETKALFDLPTILQSYYTRSEPDFSIGNCELFYVCNIIYI